MGLPMTETFTRYTHFVVLTDGAGCSDDYASLQDALTAHRRACEQPETAQSWIKEYDRSDEPVGVVASWSRETAA